MDDKIKSISDNIVMADRIAGGTIRGLYQEEYPNDSKYAKLMAEYFVSPIDAKHGEDKEWKMWREWAKKRRISLNDMKYMLQAYDSGDVNMVLGRRPRGTKDLNEIALRLRISGTLEMKAQGKGRHASRKKVAARFILYRRFGTSGSQRKAVKKGSLSALNRWAEKQGFDWVKKSSDVLGGYWEDPASLDTYEFDTV